MGKHHKPGFWARRRARVVTEAPPEFAGPFQAAGVEVPVLTAANYDRWPESSWPEIVDDWRNAEDFIDG